MKIGGFCYNMYIKQLADRYMSDRGHLRMEKGERIQLNIRIMKETSEKLDEIVEYYQNNTRLGRIYKADVLTDIIDKSYELMKKQMSMTKKF